MNEDQRATAATPGRSDEWLAAHPLDAAPIAAYGTWHHLELGQAAALFATAPPEVHKAFRELADAVVLAAAGYRLAAAQDARPAPTSASQVRRYEAQPAPASLAAAMAVIAEYERLADRLVIPNRATRAEIRKHNGLGAP